MLNKINAHFSGKFAHCRNTLKELSKDNDGNYLTGTISVGYDFDAIAGDNYKSCDALVINDKSLIFIEFKNQPANRTDKRMIKELKTDLKLKAVESVILLYKMMKENGITKKFSDIFSVKLKLIIVYSSDKTEKNHIFRNRQAVNSNIKFDLAKYAGTMFDKVETMSNEEFDANVGILY